MVVFDLDDTLYKEHAYVLSGYDAVARQVAHTAGLNPRRVLTEILSSHDAMAAASRLSNLPVDLWVNLYRNHYPSISLDPAALHLLNELKSRHIPMAIITDGRAVGQRQKYLALGLDRYVPNSRLLISEETGAEKTSPLPFQKIMAEYPDEAAWIYIGDNPRKDFLHPNSLKWTSIMLRDNFNENIHPQDLSPLPEEYHPQFTIPTLSSALQIILQNK